MFCWGERKRNTTDMVGNIVMGAALGATIAILTDRRRREEIRQTVKEWLDQGAEKVNEMQESAGRIKKAVQKEVKKEDREETPDLGGPIEV